MGSEGPDIFASRRVERYCFRMNMILIPLYTTFSNYNPHSNSSVQGSQLFRKISAWDSNQLILLIDVRARVRFRRLSYSSSIMADFKDL